MSVGKEICAAVLLMGSVWAAVSAVVLEISVRVEDRGQAWGWGASFAASSLGAAWCFGRLL